ncbi:MAG: CRISPR-associated endonuclease Cas2, partial [Microcoleaceae cyanobacterium]
MLFYLVVYDIPDNKRRKKVYDLLEGYGQWVQYSVFECVLPGNKYKELKKRLQKLVNLQEDHIRFYPLSSHTLQQVEIWGEGLPRRE